jgi:hypothetical protein
MGQRQQEAIATAITELMTSGESGEMLCCTLEAGSTSGEAVAIQVMQDSVNITPYPHDDDPLDRLEQCRATEGVDDVDLELVDWEAGKFATIGIDELEVAVVARLVDQIFTRLLGCNDSTYVPAATVEDLG